MRFRKLSEIAPSGASSSKPAPDETVWHLTLDQIESGSGKIGRRSYGRASDAGTSTFVFDTGNVLYSKLRPYLNKVICPDSSGIATTELVPLRPIPGELNREFLCFYLRSPEFVSWASAQVDGAKMPRMKMKSFWAHEMPFPPLDDQIRIADLLGKVEGLITLRKEHLQQLDDLLKSVFLEMFGDPILNPHGFPVRKLSEFYVNPKEGTKCGPFGSALKKDELVDAGVPVWNMDNIASDGRMAPPFRMWITADKYDELSAYSVKDGDIIISRAGTVGKMCVARMNEQPAIISTNLIRVRLGDELRPLHFVSLMLYCKGRVGRLKTGADGAFTHMNTGVLDSLEFPYPSIELQDQFAAVVEKVEAIKSCYQQSLTDLEALYGALSKQAFKGELDLSRVALPAVPAEGESPVAAAVPASITTPVIKLPETDLLLPALQDRTQLAPLLRFWLEAYRMQLGSAVFFLERFIAAAQTKLAELHPDHDFTLVVSDYDAIKAWVFDEIKNRKLKQTRDIICINGRRQFGNQILLRARRHAQQ